MTFLRKSLRNSKKIHFRMDICQIVNLRFGRLPCDCLIFAMFVRERMLPWPGSGQCPRLTLCTSTKSQHGVKSSFSDPLICTDARWNLATHGKNQGSWNRRFGPALRAGERLGQVEERIIIELMTSDRKLKASREGSK